MHLTQQKKTRKKPHIYALFYKLKIILDYLAFLYLIYVLNCFFYSFFLSFFPKRTRCPRMSYVLFASAVFLKLPTFSFCACFLLFVAQLLFVYSFCLITAMAQWGWLRWLIDYGYWMLVIHFTPKYTFLTPIVSLDLYIVCFYRISCM